MKELARCAVLVLLAAGAAAAYSNIAGKQVEIPKPSKAINIDGVIGEQEWADALRQELTNGGELFLKGDNSHLYVGLRGLKQGWGHIYVWGADSVYILHASAALGTAIYRKGEAGKWNPVQNYSWSLRGASQSEEAREEFLRSHLWLANNNSMGSRREIEFKVARAILTADPHIAVLYAADAQSPAYWPATLKDDCLKRELVFGNTPSDLQFDQNLWMRLAFKADR